MSVKSDDVLRELANDPAIDNPSEHPKEDVSLDSQRDTAVNKDNPVMSSSVGDLTENMENAETDDNASGPRPMGFEDMQSRDDATSEENLRMFSKIDNVTENTMENFKRSSAAPPVGSDIEPSPDNVSKTEETTENSIERVIENPKTSDSPGPQSLESNLELQKNALNIEEATILSSSVENLAEKIIENPNNNDSLARQPIESDLEQKNVVLPMNVSVNAEGTSSTGENLTETAIAEQKASDCPGPQQIGSGFKEGAQSQENPSKIKDRPLSFYKIGNVITKVLLNSTIGNAPKANMPECDEDGEKSEKSFVTDGERDPEDVWEDLTATYAIEPQMQVVSAEVAASAIPDTIPELQHISMEPEERQELFTKVDKDLKEFMEDPMDKSPMANCFEVSFESWLEDIWHNPSFKSVLPIYIIQNLDKLKYNEDAFTRNELAIKYKNDGNINYRNKCYRLALILYSEGLQVKCDDVELNAILYNRRSTCHWFLSNYRCALKNAKCALELKPDYDRPLAMTAHCYYRLQKFTRTIKYCRKILERGESVETAELLRKATRARREKHKRKSNAAEEGSTSKQQDTRPQK